MLLPSEATHINRCAAKLRSACEWGGWGRISDDGPGQNNPDRSEDPWGRAAKPLEWRCITEPRFRLRADQAVGQRNARRTEANPPVVAKGMPGAGLSGTTTGKAPSERPALKPYWGKPAVRNFRGARGNGATASAKRARSWKRRTQPSTSLKGHRASCLLDIWGGPRDRHPRLLDGRLRAPSTLFPYLMHPFVLSLAHTTKVLGMKQKCSSCESLRQITRSY